MKNFNTLTKRDIEILKYACLTNPEIAKKLIISPTTVATHLGNARMALGTSSKAAALIAAVKEGYIDINEVILDVE